MYNGLYYFEHDGYQRTPIKCNLFSDEELFKINISVQIMKRLFSNLNRSIAAQDAYEEFSREARNLHNDDPYAKGTVDRRFRAFIYEWKLYTEHWKNYIYDLDESVYPDEFIAGFKELFREVEKNLFDDADYVVTHVLRNYISHANDAIKKSHVNGEDNHFWIYRSTLLRFLDDSISNSGRRKKANLEKQRQFIEREEELIDISSVADRALTCLRRIEETLMNYQIEMQLVQACHILTESNKRINEAGLSDDCAWEFLSNNPIMILDHSAFQTITLQVEIDGKLVQETVYREPLNWRGYLGVAAYVYGFIKKHKE